MSKIMLAGMTDAPATELMPLMRSWSNPAALSVSGARSSGYDPAQKAYRLASGAGAAIDLELAASAQSPIVNPAFVVEGWGAGTPVVSVDGRDLVRGKGFKASTRAGLESTDLILWLPLRSERPVKVRFSQRVD